MSAIGSTTASAASTRRARSAPWPAGPRRTSGAMAPARRRFGPYGPLAAAADGTLYLGDNWHSVLGRIDSDGSVSTWAGQPPSGGAKGPRGKARLNFISGLLVERNGDLLLAETFRLRRVKPDGSVEDAGPAPSGAGILDSVHRLPAGGLLVVGSNGAFQDGGPMSRWFDLFVRSPGGTDRHLFNSNQAGFDPWRSEGNVRVAMSAAGRIFSRTAAPSMNSAAATAPACWPAQPARRAVPMVPARRRALAALAAWPSTARGACMWPTPPTTWCGASSAPQGVGAALQAGPAAPALALRRLASTRRAGGASCMAWVAGPQLGGLPFRRDGTAPRCASGGARAPRAPCAPEQAAPPAAANARAQRPARLDGHFGG